MQNSAFNKTKYAFLVRFLLNILYLSNLIQIYTNYEKQTLFTTLIVSIYCDALFWTRSYN